MSANVFVFQGRKVGRSWRTRGRGPKVNRVRVSDDGGGWQHAASFRRSPRTEGAVGRSPKPEVEVGIDVGSSGGDGF